MNRTIRIAVFMAAAAIVSVLFGWALLGLDRFGEYQGVYGIFFNSVTYTSRHITNVPTAVNFDFRAIDTMGEEYILFGSVVGTITLLRPMRDEAAESGGAEFEGVQRSDAVRLIALILSGLLVLFGVYIVVHAHLTPGGGFQGGAMIGTASLLVFLGAGGATYTNVSPMELMEFGHASGAGSYVAIGLAGLILNGVFLQNFLPLSTVKHFLSGGIIPLINDFVGLEVSIGFAIIFYEFIAQARRQPR
jgi:multicomponent Na+:H+ antiporter subunit B